MTTHRTPAGSRPHTTTPGGNNRAWDPYMNTFRLNTLGDPSPSVDNICLPAPADKPPPKSRAHYNRDPCVSCSGSKLKCEYEPIPGPLRVCKRCKQLDQQCVPRPKIEKAKKPKRKRNHRRCQSANAICGGVEATASIMGWARSASQGPSGETALENQIQLPGQFPVTAPPTPASVYPPLPVVTNLHQPIDAPLGNDYLFDTNYSMYFQTSSQPAVPVQAQSVTPYGYNEHQLQEILEPNTASGSGTYVQQLREPFLLDNFGNYLHFSGL